jgi:hypothetical protein
MPISIRQLHPVFVGKSRVSIAASPPVMSDEALAPMARPKEEARIRKAHAAINFPYDSITEVRRYMVEVLRECFDRVHASDVFDYGAGYEVASFIGHGADVLEMPAGGITSARLRTSPETLDTRSGIGPNRESLRRRSFTPLL